MDGRSCKCPPEAPPGPGNVESRFTDICVHRFRDFRGFPEIVKMAEITSVAEVRQLRNAGNITWPAEAGDNITWPAEAGDNITWPAEAGDNITWPAEGSCVL